MYYICASYLNNMVSKRLFKATALHSRLFIPLIGHTSFSPRGQLLRSTRWKVTVHLNLDHHQSTEIVIAKVWECIDQWWRWLWRLKAAQSHIWLNSPGVSMEPQMQPWSCLWRSCHYSLHTSLTVALLEFTAHGHVRGRYTQYKTFEVVNKKGSYNDTFV